MNPDPVPHCCARSVGLYPLGYSDSRGMETTGVYPTFHKWHANTICANIGRTRCRKVCVILLVYTMNIKHYPYHIDGGFKGVFRPSPVRLKFSENACNVHFRLLEPFIHVTSSNVLSPASLFHISGSDSEIRCTFRFFWQFINKKTINFHFLFKHK